MELELRYIKDFMNMSWEELGTATVRCGEIDQDKLFKALFHRTPNKEEKMHLDVVLGFLCDEMDDNYYELLSLEYGVDFCPLSDFCSVGDYIFNTPYNIMIMDLCHILSAIEKEMTQ